MTHRLLLNREIIKCDTLQIVSDGDSFIFDWSDHPQQVFEDSFEDSYSIDTENEEDKDRDSDDDD